MKISTTEAARTKGERTAIRILDAALDQFSRRGFEPVTMQDISAAAGVSAAALHYHFQDKDSLWTAAMEHLRLAIVEDERLLGDHAGQSPLEQLRDAMRLFLAISANHPELGRILAREGMIGGHRFDWIQRHLCGRRNQHLVDLTRRAMAAGQLRSFVPELLVVALQSAGAGLFNLAPMMEAAFSIQVQDERVLAAHEELIIDGLLAGLTLPSTSQQEET